MMIIRKRGHYTSDRYNIGEEKFIEVNLLQLREEDGTSPAKTHYVTI